MFKKGKHIPIENVEKGDQINTEKGFQTVTKVETGTISHGKEKADTVSVTTENGKERTAGKGEMIETIKKKYN